ncbi:MAG: hypothetical protein [Bacteriophage sp.]|nr:MAG: hypothetical protein [Bacteriophage sp.]
MKITNNHFFYHLAAENAIRLDWDFETELSEVYKDKPEELDKPVLEHASGDILTERDVLEASKGNVTPSFEVFFTKVYNGVSHLDSDMAVLSSMHSGSSDYLYVKDIVEMVNS